MTYTPDQVRALTPYRRTVESRGQLPELRDLFLCHAWDDRRGVATELNDLLEAEGVSVWFSEKDILLGQPFMREIDRGLAKSRAGLVLITPALLDTRRQPGGLGQGALGASGTRPADPCRARNDLRRGSERQPIARLPKRVGHGGGLDGSHCHQDRRTGRPSRRAGNRRERLKTTCHAADVGSAAGVMPGRRLTSAAASQTPRVGGGDRHFARARVRRVHTTAWVSVSSTPVARATRARTGIPSETALSPHPVRRLRRFEPGSIVRERLVRI